MAEQMTRRETLKRGLAAASLLALVPEWAMPALAQGDTDVPFTDIPAKFNPNNPTAASRVLDIRKIDGLFTPNDQFFSIQHYNKPEIDAAAYRLKLTGLVNKPIELTLADLTAMKSVEIVTGYECSGNSARVDAGSLVVRPVHGRAAARRAEAGRCRRPRRGKWSSSGPTAARKTWCSVSRRSSSNSSSARSITLENAMKPEPLLAYALNGEPLTREQGFPLRLIMPGWYGVANVKWLSEVHLQEDRYLGNYQARWYRTVRGVGGTGERPIRRRSGWKPKSHGCT